ncbi:hypothetical protein PR048_000644, partial [Dryococelus australis]
MANDAPAAASRLSEQTVTRSGESITRPGRRVVWYDEGGRGGESHYTAPRGEGGRRLQRRWARNNTALQARGPAGQRQREQLAPPSLPPPHQLCSRYATIGCSQKTYSHFISNQGATVAERLARSPPTKASRAQFPAGSPDFCKWESLRTMPLVGGFPRGSPVSSAPSFRRRSIFTSITLIGSQDLTDKSLFTYSTNQAKANKLIAFHPMRGHSGRHKLAKQPKCAANKNEDPEGRGRDECIVGLRSTFFFPGCSVPQFVCSGYSVRPPPPHHPSVRRTGFDSRRGRPRIFARGNRARPFRWSGGFLGDLPFLPALAFRRCSPLTQFHPHRLLLWRVSSFTPDQNSTLAHPVFAAEKCGSDKVDISSRIKYAIATKRKALNRRAVFSSHCVCLRDFKRVTQGVSHKLWSNDKLIAKENLEERREPVFPPGSAGRKWHRARPRRYRRPPKAAAINTGGRRQLEVALGQRPAHVASRRLAGATGRPPPCVRHLAFEVDVARPTFLPLPPRGGATPKLTPARRGAALLSVLSSLSEHSRQATAPYRLFT